MGHSHLLCLQIGLSQTSAMLTIHQISDYYVRSIKPVQNIRLVHNIRSTHHIGSAESLKTRLIGKDGFSHIIHYCIDRVKVVLATLRFSYYLKVLWLNVKAFIDKFRDRGLSRF